MGHRGAERARAWDGWAAPSPAQPRRRLELFGATAVATLIALVVAIAPFSSAIRKYPAATVNKELSGRDPVTGRSASIGVRVSGLYTYLASRASPAPATRSASRSRAGSESAGAQQHAGGDAQRQQC